jgi:tetratricopeptide (TPR) repeat protein
MAFRPRTTRRAALCGLALTALCGCAAGSPDGAGVQAPRESLGTILAHADGAFREGDYEEAQRAYEQALSAGPGDPRVAASLGTCYLKTRQVRKAETMLKEHLARRPDDAGPLLVLARVYIRQGELEPAARALRAALKTQPDSLLAHYNLGFIAYRRRDYDEAIAHLQRTIELKPDHPEAHYTLGLTHLALGRPAEAIADLERAVAIDPRHVGAHFNLAGAYARSGRLREAAKEQAIYAELSGRSKAQEERNSRIAASSVKALQRVLDKNYPEALVEYRRLAEQFPDHAPFYSEIGRLNLRLGQRPEAMQALRRAIEIDPKLSEPHYLLAGLYRDSGDTRAADRELEIFATLETIPEGKSGY